MEFQGLSTILLHSVTQILLRFLLIIMASNLPESWDEAEFIDEVSRQPELYDISQDLYSNNEHRWYCFRQIGVNFGVDGKKIYS